jgi:hypothetical protein
VGLSLCNVFGDTGEIHGKPQSVKLFGEFSCEYENSRMLG